MRPRTRRATRLAIALIGLATAVGRDAWASEASPDEISALEKRQLSYWAQGDPRWFTSGRMEGGLYLKPQLAVGFGQPYWFNVTAEAFGISTFSFGGGYTGIRGSLPFLDLRLGTRYTYSYNRSFLPVKEHYVAEDVASAHGANAHYRSLEAELTGIIPAFNGFIFPVITAYEIPDVPDGQYVFDESLRGVLKPPWIMGFRLGYVKNLGPGDILKLGVLTELVVLPGRSSIFRMGPAGAIALTDHLDLQGTLSVVIASPDSLGLLDGAFGVLGFVYRWATGDETPAFP
jgi:hypothetical protein